MKPQRKSELENFLSEINSIDKLLSEFNMNIKLQLKKIRDENRIANKRITLNDLEFITKKFKLNNSKGYHHTTLLAYENPNDKRMPTAEYIFLINVLFNTNLCEHDMKLQKQSQIIIDKMNEILDYFDRSDELIINIHRYLRKNAPDTYRQNFIDFFSDHTEELDHIIDLIRLHKKFDL